MGDVLLTLSYMALGQSEGILGRAPGISSAQMFKGQREAVLKRRQHLSRLLCRTAVTDTGVLYRHDYRVRRRGPP